MTEFILVTAGGGLGDAVCKGVARMISNAFQQIFDLGNNIVGIVRGTDGDTQISIVAGSINGSVSGTAIPALQGVGYAIALMFFLIALIDLVRNDKLTTEMFIKFFINLFVAVFFISRSPQIYDSIVKFGDALGSACTGIFSGGAAWTPPSLEELAEELIRITDLPTTDPGHMNWFQILFLGVVAVAPVYAVCVALTVITYMIAFSRLIELAVRGTFLPIGFALLSDDGFRGAGGRYFRKFVAVCAQVAALVVIAGITTLIIGTVGANVIRPMLGGAGAPNFLDLMGKIVIMIGAGIACVSVMFKSIGLINDVFGA